MEDLLAQLEAKLPLPPRVALQRQLERAIRKEAYEEAARLRDEIADLRKAAKGAEPASS
jgi:protein-arginine kinase activator protein McsA